MLTPPSTRKNVESPENSEQYANPGHAAERLSRPWRYGVGGRVPLKYWIVAQPSMAAQSGLPTVAAS